MLISVIDGKTIVHRDGTSELEEVLPNDQGDLPMNRADKGAIRSGDPSGILCDYADAMRTFAVTI
ncbi:MAG: hypothetical protein AAF702_30825 [Chloroflexota bacterium]